MLSLRKRSRIEQQNKECLLPGAVGIVPGNVGGVK